jgi:hypothetical protein
VIEGVEVNEFTLFRGMFCMNDIKHSMKEEINHCTAARLMPVINEHRSQCWQLRRTEQYCAKCFSLSVYEIITS